jgi:hypothetical protein
MDAGSQGTRSPNFRSNEKKGRLANDAQQTQLNQELALENNEPNLSDDQEMQSNERESESSLGKGKGKHIS